MPEIVRYAPYDTKSLVVETGNRGLARLVRPDTRLMRSAVADMFMKLYFFIGLFAWMFCTTFDGFGWYWFAGFVAIRIAYGMLTAHGVRLRDDQFDCLWTYTGADFMQLYKLCADLQCGALMAGPQLAGTDVERLTDYRRVIDQKYTAAPQ